MEQSVVSVVCSGTETKQDLFAGQVAFLKPWLGQEEVEAAAEVILSGWVCQGPKVMELEKVIAQYVGARYGVATNACTSALHLAMRLSGIGPGDHVIIPSSTCMATANAVHHTGATPVFADIDPKTYNLDPQSTLEALTPQTRAVVLVHQIGMPGDVDAFVALTQKHGLKLIEDGACTFGGTYKGRRVGGLGAPTCFSFHPRKMITTAEGGMITTNDGELVEKARMLRATGASISDLDRHKARGVLVQNYEDYGYNYRMTDIQAAIGLVQMQKLGTILAQRAEQARRYDEAIGGIDELDPPYVPDYVTHAYSSYLVHLCAGAPIGRDELLRRMAEQNISCRVGIQPLHFEPFYQATHEHLRLPVTEEVAAHTMFLPIYPGLTEAEQDRVIAALKNSLTRHL